MGPTHDVMTVDLSLLLLQSPSIQPEQHQSEPITMTTAIMTMANYELISRLSCHILGAPTSTPSGAPVGPKREGRAHDLRWAGHVDMIWEIIVIYMSTLAMAIAIDSDSTNTDWDDQSKIPNGGEMLESITEY